MKKENSKVEETKVLNISDVSGSFIDYLKTLPENSGQLVDLKHSKGVLRCYFMWFISDKTIDLKPIDNINIITIQKRNFDKILPVF